jgi:hypothetical protein
MIGKPLVGKQNLVVGVDLSFSPVLPVLTLLPICRLGDPAID